MSDPAEQIYERLLVLRCQAGDEAAFAEVVERFGPRLHYFVRKVLGHAQSAEDVMQDAYVRAYQHLGQFAGRAKFSTWLTRIAVHEALARAHRGKPRNRKWPPPRATPYWKRRFFRCQRATALF